MATISDDLATKIQQAFDRYYLDTANQNSFFFGANGDVTLTKPDGTTATVQSWSKMWTTLSGMGSLAGDNVFTKVNKFAAGINVTGDNTMIVMGKNSDIALLKKQGQNGTIAVGKSSAFRVQRATTDVVDPSSAFEDILTIGVNKTTTLAGALAAGGDINNTSTGKVLTQAIELSMSTPYIDFHYGSSAADYTGRIIQDNASRISVHIPSLWVQNGRLTASSTAPASPANGQQITANPVRSLMMGRGAYGDPDGAYAQMYLEEKVGTEHRAVLYLDGYGRTDAWLFRSGGTITTGKGDVMTNGSDVRLKDDITPPREKAWERIDALGVVEYRMKDETRRRRGFLAQQAEMAGSLYVYQGDEQDINGEKMRVMNVDHTAIIADLVLTVQELRRELAELKGQ